MPTLTITTNTDQATRIAAAVGDRLGLEGSANSGDVKQWIIDHIKSVVRSYETRVAAEAAANAVEDMPDPT